MNNRGPTLKLIIYTKSIFIIFLWNLDYLSARAKTICSVGGECVRKTKHRCTCGRRVVIREQEYRSLSRATEFCITERIIGRVKYAKYIEHRNELSRTVEHN